MSDYSDISRRIEVEALQRIQSVLGTEFNVRDLTSSPNYDFEINKKGALVGIGEISWLQDRQSLSAFSALRKQERHHLIALAPGSGLWSLRVRNTCNINRLYRELPAYISQLISAGLDSYESEDGWTNIEMQRICNDLQIITIFHSEDGGVDDAFYVLEGSGGFVPQELGPLARRIEELMDTSAKDNWTKLQATAAPEKHIYFRQGKLVPQILTDVLSINNPNVIIPSIQFPKGITHIWFEAAYQNMKNVLWRRDDLSQFF